MKKIKLIHEICAVKNKKELRNIIKAQKINEKVLGYAVAQLKIGITEIEIADFIKKYFIKFRVPVLAFTPLVAFGKNTANIHHFTPTKTKLKRGDMVMIDFGCTVNGYCSDMTRTFFFGEPSKKQEKLYKIVLEAQEKSLQKLIKGEKRARVVDKVARDFIAKKYKNNFKHGLGHGVGTVIHEWPNFKPNTADILPVGCVMTVEPGVYLKNFGGARIEDMVVITKKSCVNLTDFPKDIKNVTLAIQ
jgi:Xaa-Pro aminopeptidase